MSTSYEGIHEQTPNFTVVPCVTLREASNGIPTHWIRTVATFNKSVQPLASPDRVAFVRQSHLQATISKSQVRMVAVNHLLEPRSFHHSTCPCCLSDVGGDSGLSFRLDTRVTGSRRMLASNAEVGQELTNI
jgi:hypothetical protein